jgi:hypothetical protein
MMLGKVVLVLLELDPELWTFTYAILWHEISDANMTRAMMDTLLVLTV